MNLRGLFLKKRSSALLPCLPPPLISTYSNSPVCPACPLAALTDPLPYPLLREIILDLLLAMYCEVKKGSSHINETLWGYLQLCLQPRSPIFGSLLLRFFVTFLGLDLLPRNVICFFAKKASLVWNTSDKTKQLLWRVLKCQNYRQIFVEF